MHRLTITAVTCAALALGACGSSSDTSDSSSTPSTTPAAPATSGGVVKVAMKDVKFIPHDITVKVGQKIEWTNDDSFAHNVTAKDGADFASDTINGGGTYAYTPKKAGVIHYYCTIHNGQDGTITVVK